jgi:hypothetical protein
MRGNLYRSISQPVRGNLSWHEMWEGPDKGLICCWERGREKRLEEPELAARASRGELIVLAWRGGIEKKMRIKKKSGTLHYLATWQGLRGEDLNIDLEAETTVICSKTEQVVVFSAKVIEDENMDEEVSLFT